MTSPSSGEACHRGGTQVGKAPPWPEMTLSSLTRGQVFGESLSAKIRRSPALPDGAARPFRRAVSFLGSRLQRLSANHFAPPGIPHRGRSAVKHVLEVRCSVGGICYHG